MRPLTQDNLQAAQKATDAAIADIAAYGESGGIKAVREMLDGLAAQYQIRMMDPDTQHSDRIRIAFTQVVALRKTISPDGGSPVVF